MQTHADITLALLKRAAELAVADPVAGGNLAITMPDVIPPWGAGDAPDRYLSISLFDNRPAWEAIGPGKLDQGLMQISVVWPRNNGPIEIRTAVQAVLDHFPKALLMRQGTACVKVSGEPWAASALVEESQTMIPVTVPWVASSV